MMTLFIKCADSQFVLAGTFLVFVMTLFSSAMYGTSFLPEGKLDTLSTTSTAIKKPSLQETLSYRKSLFDQYRLHDTTLQLEMDPYIRREWLEFEHNNETTKSKPPAMLLLTNFGWNQPNQIKGLTCARFIRISRLVKGLINHPWFHPTAWEDIAKGNATIHPDVRYYVFPDWSTCYEAHWPVYGGYEKNLDVDHNRTDNPAGCSRKDTFELFSHPLFQKHNSNNSMIIEVDCQAFGPTKWRVNKRKRMNASLAFATMSANVREMMDPIDQGLPPPCGKPITLTQEQVQDIATCAAESEANRPFLLTYLGNFRSHGPPVFNARKKLAQFNDNNKTFILQRHFNNQDNPIIGNMSYTEIMSKSLFSAAPRGDNKFSYRFCEVLSAGAIPVVFADDWLWPFRPELLDWGECAIVLPENSPHMTMNVINNITMEERCKRRQRCYEIYKQYIEEDRGTFAAVIQGLELVAQGQRAPTFGVLCSPEDDPAVTCNFARRLR